MYVLCMCVRVHVQSLTAIRVLSCLGPEHLEPFSYRPLTYRGAVPGLPESCCVALVHVQPIIINFLPRRENVWLGGGR